MQNPSIPVAAAASPLAGSQSGVAAVAANPQPAADAGEIGAFVAALLGQTIPNPEPASPPATTLPDGAPDPAAADADPAAAVPLPTASAAQTGQALAAALQNLPSDGHTRTAPDPAPGTPPAARPMTNPRGRPQSFAPSTAVTTAAGFNPGALRPDLPGALPVVPDTQTAVLAEHASVARDPAAVNANAAPAENAGNAAALTRAGESTTPAVAAAAKNLVLPATQPGVFGDRLQQQIAVMVSHNASHARLAVNPAELGPVEVRVSVVADEASVQLAAVNPATRDMLEDALPRLRAAFADSGVQLGSADVFTQMPDRGAQGDAAALATGGDSANPGADAEADDMAPPLRVVRLGLVDAFV